MRIFTDSALPRRGVADYSRDSPRSSGISVVAPRFLGCPIRGDAYRDFHAEKVGREAGPSARERHCPPRVANDRDADQIAVADDAAGRVVLDPAGAGYIDLQPGMGGAAADLSAVATFRDVEISRNEAGRQAQRADCFDHQHGEVAATAAAEL